MKKRLIITSLKGLAHLPLPVLYLLADFIYLVINHVIGYRKRVIIANLKSAFPEKTDKEIKKITKENYHFIADIIVETVKLLHISDAEMKKRVVVENAESVNDSLKTGKSAVILLGHYGNWEWVQEISRYFLPGSYNASIYHPLHNKLWDDIYGMIRGRWGAHIVPQKKAVRTLLDKRNMPWVCGFIADHRPTQRNEDNMIEFLNHKTYFIYGPEQIGEKVKADYFYLEMNRVKRGYYKIIFHPLDPEVGKSYPYTRSFWHKFEETLCREPAYWLWSHKRWKE